MPTLLNTSDVVIAPKYDNAITKFAPGQELDVFNSYAAVHMLRRMAKHGLVELKYGVAEEMTYGDFSAYRQAKVVEGRTALLNTLDEQIKTFEIFLAESEDRPSIQRNQMKQAIEKVRARRAEVAKLLEQAVKSPKISPEQILQAKREKLAALQAEVEAMEERLDGGNVAKSA